jgi:DNA-nicking Smr family endonuclease
MKKNMHEKRKKHNKYVNNIDAQIDLHGLYLEEAQQKVQLFLLESKKKGLNRVLVITGKGIHSKQEGVLHKMIPDFIRRLNFSCISAKINNGGEGAFEVSLQ